MTSTAKITANDLTIVIPAKNEAKLIPRLLTSLTNQDYSKMSSTRVLVADANSTDGTPDIVMSFRDRLSVGVIHGGMPAFGRNQGAALADTPFVLFLDADIELADRTLIRRCIEKAQAKQLHCVTTNILCKDGSWIDRLFYAGNDFFQYLSYLHRPFATGMFMRVRPDRYPYETGVDSEQIFAASQMLSEITGVPVQPNKAITGRNAFAHEAGIHQDGVLKNPLTYEIMPVFCDTQHFASDWIGLVSV